MRAEILLILVMILVSVIVIGIYQKVPVDERGKETEIKAELVAKPPVALGDISYENIQKDASINAIIDSSQKLDNGNLIVKFHHNSNKEEPVSVVGAVRYELSKVTAKPNEVITLTVFDWNDEYFELKVGSTSDIFAFGRIPPDREIEIDRPNYQTIKYQVGDPKDGKFAVLSGGVINYKDGETFKPINLTLIDKGGYWQATEASYHPKIPKYADDWFEFRNVFEGNDHTVKTRPVAGHVEGILSGTGEMKNRVVVYPNAFGKGIDLEIYAYNTNLLKKIVIREPQTKELNFDFELEKPFGKAFQLHDNEKKEKQDIEFADSMKFKGKEILFGEENPTIMFVPQLWDNSSLQEDVEITLYKDKGKTFLRKTIPLMFLENATYPVYTDDDTGLKFPGVGDTCIGTWTTPGNILADDGNYASITISDVGRTIQAYNFAFGLAAGDTVDGIEIKIEARSSVANERLRFYLEYDGSCSWVSPNEVKTLTTNLATADTIYTAGNSTDKWGQTSITGNNVSDANFRAVAEVTEDELVSATFYIDHIQVKIYYTPVTDTCTYSSGNWAVTASDNCTISSAVNMGGNAVNINGTGTFKMTANIRNWNRVTIVGSSATNIARVTCTTGCFIG